MLVAELEQVIERRAPRALAQPGDNCGLLVGDKTANVRRVLVALELTEAVLDEAAARSCDTILTHHPFIFVPVRTFTAAEPRTPLLRRLIVEGRALVACHTNVDAARGGLADLAAEALGLAETTPLQPASAGWHKLVAFVPAEAVEQVARAVFSAGAGRIGDYEDCAFTCEGVGWFTPGPGAHPAVGEALQPERVREVRWETVVPRGCLAQVIAALVRAHPYEEPAFDVYPVEDVLPRVGLGRVGILPAPISAERLAKMVVERFALSHARVVGEDKLVSRVGVLPGSGRGMLETAVGCCDALITGDLGYHDAERAVQVGVALIDVPHGEFEWWAFARWAQSLAEELVAEGVELVVSEKWQPSWRVVAASVLAETQTGEAQRSRKKLRLWIDGGSRGNPGPCAIGVVIEDEDGNVVETIRRTIGFGTNNLAEYRALLTALERAESLGAGEVEVFSDSELLVRQLKGEYKVKSENLRPLHAEALRRMEGFASFVIKHVSRAENKVADMLVNEALDEGSETGL